MRPMCHFVLLSTCAAALSGCYLDHTRGAPGAPPVVDAGVALDASTPARDASVSIDAGAPLCPLVRPDATCLESFLVAPGRAFRLPYTFQTCACCVETSCSVDVDATTQTLRLGTTLCPDPCECDECVTPEGSCEVPPLARGMWTVVVNGEPAFQLPVEEDSGFVPPPPACATYAEADRCAPSPVFPGSTWPDGGVCVAARREAADRDVLVLYQDCWPCGALHGPCYASLEPRSTDDLPPGGEIRITPTRYDTTCDVDCPGVCFESTQTCVVPQLVDGDVYRVYFGDRLLSTFTAGSAVIECDRAGEVAGALPVD